MPKVIVIIPENWSYFGGQYAVTWGIWTQGSYISVYGYGGTNTGLEQFFVGPFVTDTNTFSWWYSDTGGYQARSITGQLNVLNSIYHYFACG